MKKLKLGIVGLGAIGERLIKVLLTHEGFKITGIFDASNSRLQEIAEQYDLPSMDSFEAMLSSPEIEAVYLAVPPKSHSEMAIKIVESGKHILCEKPLASTVDEAEKMLAAAKKSGVVHAMNFPLNYTSAIAKMDTLLSNREIGIVKGIEIYGRFPNWPRLWQINPWIDSKDQGGFTREVFTHFVQIVVDRFGPIKSLCTTITYPMESNKSETVLLAHGRLDDEIPIAFSGLTGIGHYEEIKLVIYGDKKTLELSNWRDLFVSDAETGRQKVSLDEVNASYVLIDAFYQKILGNPAKVIDFTSGHKTTEVIESLLDN